MRCHLGALAVAWQLLWLLLLLLLLLQLPNQQAQADRHLQSAHLNLDAFNPSICGQNRIVDSLPPRQPPPQPQPQPRPQPQPPAEQPRPVASRAPVLVVTNENAPASPGRAQAAPISSPTRAPSEGKRLRSPVAELELDPDLGLVLPTEEDELQRRRLKRATASARSSSEWRARPGEFPWYARLELRFQNPHVENITVIRFCGATVIHRSYLLTSYSCFHRPPLSRALSATAYAGLHSLLEPAAHWQKRQVKATCDIARDRPPHGSPEGPGPPARPKQSEPARDVLVVELAEPLVYGDRVQPVCLPSPRSSVPFSFPRVTAMAGFGITNHIQAEPPAYMNLQFLFACHRHELPEVAAQMHPDQICLSSRQARVPGNPCEGDQGNGVYAFLPNRAVGLFGILGQPPALCARGQATATLFTQLQKLGPDFDQLLSDCVRQLQNQSYYSQASVGSRHRKRALPIERLTIKEPQPE